MGRNLPAGRREVDATGKGGDGLRTVVESSSALAARDAIAEVAFHLWISHPTAGTRQTGLPRPMTFHPGARGTFSPVAPGATRTT